VQQIWKGTKYKRIIFKVEGKKPHACSWEENIKMDLNKNRI
jgi:hypothetical protein